MSAKLGLFEKYPNRYFIETGTCIGDGVYQAIDAGFQIIISIELSEELYNICVREFKYYPNVILYNGDSTEILWDVIKDINNPITFWLDSHYCGHIMNIESMHNKKEKCPIVEEIEIISKHPIKTHTILIDDIDYLYWINFYDMIKSINKDYNIDYANGNSEKSILIASI